MSFGKTWLRGPGDGATEIVSGTEQLYQQLERVKVTLPEDWNTLGNWDEIADAGLRGTHQVLAIVNTRADCRELHRRMPGGTVQISALMCGEHRSSVIKRIKQRLKDKESGCEW